MSPPWMPLNIADYLRDTTHLNGEKSGAYLHLIMAYWVDGGLPNDNHELAQIAKISLYKWNRIRPTIEAFFSPGFSSHKRIDFELQRAARIKEVRSEMGRQAARKRWNKHAGGNADGMRLAMRTGMPGDAPTQRKKDLTDREIEEGAVDKCGQVAGKRSAEEGKDAVAEMRARRMLARKGRP